MYSKVVAVILMALIFFSAGCSSNRQADTFSIPQKGKLTIGGTGANIPLLKKLAEGYMVKHTDIIWL